MDPNPPPLAAPAPTSGLVIASLICGILALPTCGLSGIAGAITGHLGLSDIKKSGGRKKGTGMAVAGLVLSYTCGLIGVIAAIAGMAAPLMLQKRQTAELSLITANTSTIGSALQMFEIRHGSFPSGETMDAVAGSTASDGSLAGSHVLDQMEGDIVQSMDDLLSVGSFADGDWFYRPGLGSDDPSAPVVLVSPAIRGRCVVLRVDGEVETHPEAEARALMVPPDEFVAIPAPPRE